MITHTILYSRVYGYSFFHFHPKSTLKKIIFRNWDIKKRKRNERVAWAFSLKKTLPWGTSLNAILVESFLYFSSLPSHPISKFEEHENQVVEILPKVIRKRNFEGVEWGKRKIRCMQTFFFCFMYGMYGWDWMESVPVDLDIFLDLRWKVKRWKGLVWDIFVNVHPKIYLDQIQEL